MTSRTAPTLCIPRESASRSSSVARTMGMSGSRRSPNAAPNDNDGPTRRQVVAPYPDVHHVCEEHGREDVVHVDDERGEDHIGQSVPGPAVIDPADE